MPGSMLILTWVGIIFVKILQLAPARCKIMTNIMPTHVKISIEPGIRELFLQFQEQKKKPSCVAAPRRKTRIMFFLNNLLKSNIFTFF
jgi:hypothetical protein